MLLILQLSSGTLQVISETHTSNTTQMKICENVTVYLYNIWHNSKVIVEIKNCFVQGSYITASQGKIQVRIWRKDIVTFSGTKHSITGHFNIQCLSDNKTKFQNDSHQVLHTCLHDDEYVNILENSTFWLGIFKVSKLLVEEKT